MSTVRGFSTLELLIALMVMMAALIATMLVIFGIPAMIASAAAQRGAVDRASSLLDEQRHIGQQNFSLVSSVATTTATTSDGTYDSSLVVSMLPDELTKRLESTVAWTDVHGIRRVVTLVSLLTDFHNPDSHSCSGVLSGNWKAPAIHSYTLSNGNLLPSNISIATTSVAALAASADHLFVGASTLAREGDPDLFIFSTNTIDRSPLFESSLSTSSTTAGIAAIAATRSYLYIANASSCTTGPSCGQLQIVDIRDPSHPVLLGRLLFSTGIHAVAAKSIYYQKDRVYLGLMKTPDGISTNKGSEFNVIDVHDPTIPKLLGGYAVGRTVNAIYVANDIAYLATDARADSDVIILDVHDPTTITRVDRYSAPPSSNTTAGYIHAITRDGGYLYIGRTAIRNGDELIALDDTSTALSAIASKNTTTSIEDLIAQGSVLFSLATHELDLWDISDPHTVTSFGNPIPLPFSGTARNSASDFACSGNVLYAGSNAADGTGAITVIHGS